MRVIPSVRCWVAGCRPGQGQGRRQAWCGRPGDRKSPIRPGLTANSASRSMAGSLPSKIAVTRRRWPGAVTAKWIWAGRSSDRPNRRAKLADRSVVGQRIAAGPDRAEMEPALGVGDQAATQVVLGLVVGVLVFIAPAGVGMPDLDLCPGKPWPSAAGDPPRHGQRRAHAVAAKVGAQGQARRIGAVERPGQGRWRDPRPVSQRAVKRTLRQAEDIRQQHPFLPPRIGRIADIGQELHQRVQLLRRGAQGGDDLEGMVDQTARPHRAAGPEGSRSAAGAARLQPHGHPIRQSRRPSCQSPPCCRDRIGGWHGPQ